MSDAICERCLKPASDPIHGPHSACADCDEPKAHHRFGSHLPPVAPEACPMTPYKGVDCLNMIGAVVDYYGQGFIVTSHGKSQRLGFPDALATGHISPHAITFIRWATDEERVTHHLPASATAEVARTIDVLDLAERLDRHAQIDNGDPENGPSVESVRLAEEIVSRAPAPSAAAPTEAEVLREKVVEAAKALAPFLPDAGASTSERWILWERGVELAKQLRALLAAEAEGGVEVSNG